MDMFELKSVLWPTVKRAVYSSRVIVECFFGFVVSTRIVVLELPTRPYLHMMQAVCLRKMSFEIIMVAVSLPGELRQVNL